MHPGICVNSHYAFGYMSYVDLDCHPCPNNKSDDDIDFHDRFRFQFPVFEIEVLLMSHRFHDAQIALFDQLVIMQCITGNEFVNLNL